jgi:AcrR family transcriptional regulator
MTIHSRRGKSKADWLEAALQELSRSAVVDLSVGRLAKKLGIARAGFYWHFQDKNDFLDALLEYWIHETTEIATNNPQIASLDPMKRLRAVAKMVIDNDLGRYELAFRQWALTDKRAAKKVREVNKIRTSFIRKAFRDMGFNEEEAEIRALIFVTDQTWEKIMFPELSKKKLRELIDKRLALLTAKPAD